MGQDCCSNRKGFKEPHAGQNKLLDRIFAINEYKDQYLALVKEMNAANFTSGRQLDVLEQIQPLLKEPLAKEKQAFASRREGKGFGGGQFGQSMPPRRFIADRTQSVAAQLEGKSKGFVPKPFGPGFGPGFGPPPAANGGVGNGNRP